MITLSIVCPIVHLGVAAKGMDEGDLTHLFVEPVAASRLSARLLAY